MTSRKIRAYSKKLAIGFLLVFVAQQEAFALAELDRGHRQPIPPSLVDRIQTRSLAGLDRSHHQPIPPSLVDRIQTRSIQAKSLQESVSLECGINAMCASFNPPVAADADVVAWMGFKYESPGIPIEFFIATLGRQAFLLQDNLYATPLWDKKHFWIKVDEDTVPLAIQPRYIGRGTGIYSDYEYYAADYFAYQRHDNDTDYSEYPYINASLSSLIIEFNPLTETVTDSWVDYYDKDLKYVESIVIELGDAIIPYFLGFERSEPDEFYLFQMEPAVTVTMEPQFFYVEAYPGSADFPCTECGDLDTSKVQFHYMFESFTEKAQYEWQFTDPMPIIYAIATLVTPNQGGGLTCDPNPVEHGGSSNCTATANIGYQFTTWSGDCTGTTCDLVGVDAARTVVARFEDDPSFGFTCTPAPGPATVMPPAHQGNVVVESEAGIVTDGVVIVPSGVSVGYMASDSITLKENFHAENGSRFQAIITDINCHTEE